MSTRQWPGLLSIAVIVSGSAVLLAAVVGFVALLAMTSPESNSVEVIVALSSVGTALATGALAVAALLALRSLGESRRDRNAGAMTDLSQRWDSEHFRGVRHKIQAYSGSDAESGLRLRDKLIKLRQSNDELYRELLTEPGFLEDLAISVKYGGIYFDIVKDSLGYIVWDRWCLWYASVVELRLLKAEPTVFEHFQGLAERMKREIPGLPDLDKWNGPKD